MLGENIFVTRGLQCLGRGQHNPRMQRPLKPKKGGIEALGAIGDLSVGVEDALEDGNTRDWTVGG